MSSFSGYKTTAFKETQKFFVLDPATGSPSFVQGSDLVSYLRPSLNSVDVETTTGAAVNADYDVGKVIQTTGESSPGDGNPGLFLVVAAGTGGIPMLNGNELLVLEGANTALGISYDNTTSGYSATNVQEAIDNFAVNTAGEGSDLVAHTGTADTVTEALNKRTIYVSSVAELETLTVGAGHVVDLNAGGMSGAFDVISGDFSAELSADTYNAIYVGLADDPTALTKVAKRRETEVVRASWFGIVDDPTLAIDQTAKVKEFFRVTSENNIGVAYNATVGFSDRLLPPSNLKLLCKDFTLKNRSDFVGVSGFRLSISFETVSDIRIEGLILDGNESTFGGLIPVFAGDAVRGIGIRGGCENIVLDGVKANNVQGNAFIHFSGGSSAQSKNVYFNRCSSANSGLGFTQEIPQGAQVTPDGPGYTEYNNCVSNLCNYGLYIAGGTFKVNGGYFHSKRLQSLVIYTGDAHAVTKGEFNGSVFEITPEVGTASCGYIHCINKQSIAPEYENQQDLNVSFNGVCKFIQNGTGRNLEIEEGSNVYGSNTIFAGGSTNLFTVKSTLTGGPYRQGVIEFIKPDLTGFTTDGVRFALEVILKSPRFRAPGGAGTAGGVLVSGGFAKMYNPIFGAVDDATVLASGLQTSVSGTKAIVIDAEAVNVTTPYNVALGGSNYDLWVIQNTSPANALDQDQLYGRGTPEGVVTARIGRLYSDMDGGAGVTLYVKETGLFTNTGWVAK